MTNAQLAKFLKEELERSRKQLDADLVNDVPTAYASFSGYVEGLLSCAIRDLDAEAETVLDGAAARVLREWTR